VPVWKAGGSSVPDAWRQPFTKRNTPLMADTHQHAADPVNALLNYAYSIAETVAVLACWKTGLDPALGMSHVPETGRYSLALDLVETIRPECDALVLDLLGGLRAEWFAEVKSGPYAGSCRLVAPLTHQIAEQMGAWGERAERYAARVAAALTACAAANPLGTSTIVDTTGYRPAKVNFGDARKPGKAALPPQTVTLVPDDLWQQVRPLVPEHSQRKGNPRAHPRRVVAALLWTQVLGRSWRSVRDGAGIDHTTVQAHFKVWRANGTWDQVRPLLEQYVSHS
jgi:hypothetical protein